MDRRFALAVIAASLHLVLVLCGAAHLRIRVGPGNGAIARSYGALTASEANFAFYAPAVPAFPEATFELTDADGHQTTDTLERHRNEESDLRLTASAFRFEESRDALALSWTAAMFARHPDAVRIALQVDRFDPPTMAEWRRGDRGRTAAVFRATIDRPAEP